MRQSRHYRLMKPGDFFVSSTVYLGESWVPYAPILVVMRWLGKAPRVAIISTRTLEEDIVKAGFVDPAQPEVGAKSTIAFIVATKRPAT